MANRWEDVRAPATAINPPGLASDPDWDATQIGWLFDGGATELLYIVLQLPHGYREGSDAVFPHIHWEPTDTSTGNVLWRLTYRWRNNGDVAGSFTDLDMLTPCSGTANKLAINGFGSIGKQGANVSSIFECKLSRIGGDASDTVTSDVRLKEFDLHIQVDDIGSINETSKT